MFKNLKVNISIMFDNSLVFDVIASFPVKRPSTVTWLNIINLVQVWTEIKETLEEVNLLWQNIERVWEWLENNRDVGEGKIGCVHHLHLIERNDFAYVPNDESSAAVAANLLNPARLVKATN